ncbi:MAG: protein-disulfide reductase DsbD domain-containing protein, partial [Acetobacteraceae bacterium]
MMARQCFVALVLPVLLALGIPSGPSRAAATDWVGNAHAAARLITAVEATGSSTRLDAGLQIRLAPGWHTYWRTPGDAGVPPTIDWEGSRNIAAATIAWPAPRRLPAIGGLETQGYEDGVVLPIAVTLSRTGEAVSLHAEVDYAACSQVCIPYHASLDLALPPGLAVPGTEAPLIAAASRQVPRSFADTGLQLDAVVAGGGAKPVLSVRLTSSGAPFRAPDLFIEGAKGASPGRPEVTLADAGRIATLRIPFHGAAASALVGVPLWLTVVDGDRAAAISAVPHLGALPSLGAGAPPLAMIGVALLGGLILNLM